MSNATQLRDEAFGLTKQAQVALEDGNVDQASQFSSDAETKLQKAEEYETAEKQIRVLQADQRDLDATRIEATPSNVDLVINKKEIERKGSRNNPDYKPQNYIKGMPAAAQPKYILDNCGENVIAESDAYTDAFRAWASYPNETAFRLNAEEWQIKQMTEGTDADGGFYVPEQFIARNVELYQGIPGGTLRDRTTNIRVTSKDGYAPSMAAVTWSAKFFNLARIPVTV